MSPTELRALAQEVGIRDELTRRVWKALRTAANELERLRSIETMARNQEAIYEEVVDGLASAEREKVQQEMAGLRARIAILSADSADDE